MSLWDALRMNMMISYQELVRTFHNLNGVLIGRSAAPDVSDPTKHNYLDALKAAFENIAVPVLYDVDIGHMPPQISLVNGADATVFFAENGSWVTQQL
ncbi:S66 peptidase family protein [Klebsiella variicola]|nr:hypothetical protein [Klebsiella variicola]